MALVSDPSAARKVRVTKSRANKCGHDLAMAEAFLDRFDGLITFQTFADQKSLKRKEIANTLENYAQKDNPRAKLKTVMVDPLARTHNGSLDDYADRLVQLNEKGAGIFFAVNEMDGGGRKFENLKRLRAIWADLDGAPLPKEWPLAPSLVVESSPGKFHV
jgi:hypothetical protein